METAIANDDTNETNTDSSRKLGSIQLVTEVNNHPSADRLELATVLGWQIVTRIGETKVGTKVIYCEIDGMLPGDAAWLPSAVQARIQSQKDPTWYRIKTIKLRKEISQGLIVPIVPAIKNMEDYEVGTNVTQELGIKKYEPPALSGLFATGGNSGIKFPTHLLGKTDEPRVQSEPGLFKVLQNQPYYISVKCDGTSGTFVIDPESGDLLVCSRNLVRKRPDNPNVCPYWYLAAKYDIENKLKDLGGHIAIQGEICGPNIQKNLMKLTDLELFVFNVIDIRDQKILPYSDFVRISKQLGLKTAPIEEVGDSFECDTIKDLLTKAEGKYKNTKQQREGIVIRSQNQDISFKAINNRYLLKHGY